MAVKVTHELVTELAEQVLRGEFDHINADALTERLSDSDEFWCAVLVLIKSLSTKGLAHQWSELSNLHGTVSGIAFNLAIDAAPNITKKLEDQRETEQAIEKAEAML